MAKRRVKKRTHAAAPAPGSVVPSKPGSRTPKSMVIRIGAGEVGPSVTQLVHDVRTMMEPHTATRLKERRNNKLRDYTTMAGPLGVTHLLLFGRSASGNTNLRLVVTPRGPTLHFRVESYSLCKDVHRSQRRPQTGGDRHFAPPLLVMNNMSSPDGPSNDKHAERRTPKHLESLTTTVFQSLFPPINPTTTPLQSIKRVLLVDRSPPDTAADHASYVLNLRHYAISTRTAKSVAKPLRRLDAAEKLSHIGRKCKRSAAAQMPDLGRLKDVSDFLLDPHAADGFTSESEPDTDAEVEVLAPTTQKVAAARRTKAKKDALASEARVEKKAIKLQELGPRLRLRLTKVEEGVCGGKVMWHEYIHKTAEEMAEMERVHEERRRERERRREEQRANVERKRAEKRAKGGGRDDGEMEEDEEDDDDEFEDDEWDDDDWDEEANGDVGGIEDEDESV
ncbi:hypothetical protein M433DRAFT_53385, partial [Acidomyces richmondensis BFW]